MEAHAHVHAVVPGGGPALVGGHWKDATAPDGRPKGWYLVDAVTLRRTFREHFIKGLRRLFADAELARGEFARLLIADEQEALLAELEKVEWVSYIEPPPRTGGCRPELVLKYLARYRLVAHLDGRIVSADERQVTFLARKGKVTGGQREQVPINMSTVEFARLWSLHSAQGLHQIASLRWLEQSPQGEACPGLRYSSCKTALPPLAPEALSFDTAALEQLSLRRRRRKRCKYPKCGAAMSETAASLKPSWYDVTNSPYRPCVSCPLHPRL